MATEDELSLDAQFDAKIYLGMDDSAFTGEYRLEITSPKTDWVDVQNRKSVTLIKIENDIIGRASNEDAFKVSLKENGFIEVAQYRSLSNNAIIKSSGISFSAQIKDNRGDIQWVSTPLLIDLDLVEDQ